METPTAATAATAASAAAAAAASGRDSFPEVKADDANSPLDVDDDWRHRTELFDLLVAFYPPNMTQPKHNLVDLVAL